MERQMEQIHVAPAGYDQQRLDSLVARIFIIEDITTGNPEHDFIVRYRGRLRSEDSEAAYDQLAENLRPYQITPLFRWDEDRHMIALIPGRPQPKASNPVINLVMFILTIISVLIASAQVALQQASPGNFGETVQAILREGWPFTVSFLAILGAHEFGHYLMGRRHGVHVTLPYFIPAPFLGFGTLGAFIQMKEAPKNRRQLLDIGLAGPLAGLVVAIPVLILGLSLSTLDPLPSQAPQGFAITLEGNSLLYMGLKYLVFGQLLPVPASFGSQPEWLYWLQYFFTGRPFPFGGMDVLLHPVAFAGWAGILITALNLIPAGQFDGGHVVYTLFGRKVQKRIFPILLIVLALMGLFWVGWWIWIVLIFFLGRVHAETLDQITELDDKRRRIGMFAILVFILVFTPVPLNLML